METPEAPRTGTPESLDTADKISPVELLTNLDVDFVSGLRQNQRQNEYEAGAVAVGAIDPLIDAFTKGAEIREEARESYRDGINDEVEGLVEGLVDKDQNPEIFDHMVWLLQEYSITKISDEDWQNGEDGKAPGKERFARELAAIQKKYEKEITGQDLTFDLDGAGLDKELTERYENAVQKLAKVRVSNLNGAFLSGRRLKKAQEELAEIVPELEKAYAEKTGIEASTVARKIANDVDSRLNAGEQHQLTESFSSKAMNKYANLPWYAKAGLGGFVGVAGWWALPAGAVTAGVLAGAKAARSVFGGKSRAFKGDKQELVDAFATKKARNEEQIKTSDHGTALDILQQIDLSSETELEKSQEHKKRGRRAVYIGLGALAVGRGINVLSRRDEVKDFFSGAREYLKLHKPMDIGINDHVDIDKLPNSQDLDGDGVLDKDFWVNGIEAHPGENFDQYFERVYSEEWDAFDRYNFGRLVEWGDTHGADWRAANPNSDFNDTLKEIAKNTSPAQHAEKARVLTESLTGLENVAGGIDSGVVAEVAELHQDFADDAISNLNLRFNDMWQQYDRDTMIYMYDHSEIFEDIDLRNEYKAWWIRVR